jgi:hypothetical protein
MRVIEFTLSRPTMTLNEARALHFHAYRRHQIKLAWEISLATVGNRPAEPLRKAILTVNRHSVGTPDHDGLVGGLKSFIDCLLPLSKRHPRGLGFILDDAPSCMTLVAKSIRVLRLSEQLTFVRIQEVV